MHNAKLLDVRTKEEHLISHINGAHHIPLSELSVATLSKYFKKEDQIYVFCASGGRSAVGAQCINNFGFKATNLPCLFSAIKKIMTEKNTA